MELKAIKPQIVQPGKPKLLLSGRSGVGKTMFALEFPSPYLIDVEGGATREQYSRKLESSYGAYFGKDQGSQDIATVIEEIKALATVKHGFKTLIIDSFSHLYNTVAAIAEEKIGNEFGRDKKEANRPTRQLLRWLEAIDMNVVLICHQREKWQRSGKEVVSVGTTFDGYEKLEYILDLWLEIQKVGSARFMVVKKSRIDGFPEAKEMSLEFKSFADIYGADIVARDTQPVSLATQEQIQTLKALVTGLNISKETIEATFEKLKVDKWEEVTSEQAMKVIASLTKQMPILPIQKQAAGRK